MRPALSLFLGFILIVATISFGPGCAVIVPPEGGPRDTIPPVLLSADPPDSTVNFNAKRIVLTFDENIADLYETQKNLLFTPIFENNPVIQLKGRTVTIPFKDPLQPNTTYILNFGDAIKDVNEGNTVRNFKYVFSTGPALDSLEISGRVLLAETGGIDTTLIAMLHTDLRDSAVKDRKPQYVARLDRNGYFHFGNLPRDTFKIYVLGDAGIVRRYQNPSALFGFADSAVIAGSSDSVTLYAYREKPAGGSTISLPSLTKGPVGGANDRRLRITPRTTTTQDLLEDYYIDFATPLKTFDSTKLQLSTDSTFNRVSFTTQLDSTRRVLRLQSPWKEDTRYNLILDRDFAADSSGRQLLKTDTLSFTTRKLSEYGKLTLRYAGIDSTKHPVLQFVQNGQVIRSVPFASGIFTADLFIPGDYELRILFDTNNNGKWDPGSFPLNKRQPEIVVPVRQKLTVKPNWDNTLDIQ